MTTRFASNAMIALLGGLVVVLSMGLASTFALGWVAFGIAIGIVAISLLVQLDVHRGMAQRLLDVALLAVGGTLIAVSVIFTGTTLTWLVFALALGFVGVGFTGLTLHEIETWRYGHRLGELRWLHPQTLPEERETAVSAPRAA